MVQTTLGLRLRKARDEARLSQAEVGKRVAKAIGRSGPFSASAITQWEKDETKPGVDAIVAFATLTGSDLSWLMTGVISSGGDEPFGSQVRGGKSVPKLHDVSQALKIPVDYAHDASVRAHFPCNDGSFALDVFDGRNEPDLKEGVDVVIVDLDEPPRPGDMVLADIDGQPLLGMLIMAGGQRKLTAANDYWDTATLKDADRIVGIVTERKSPMRRAR